MSITLEPRDYVLSIKMTKAEYEAVMETAAVGGQKGSPWARDVILSRVAALAWARR